MSLVYSRLPKSNHPSPSSGLHIPSKVLHFSGDAFLVPGSDVEGPPKAFTAKSWMKREALDKARRNYGL